MCGYMLFMSFARCFISMQGLGRTELVCSSFGEGWLLLLSLEYVVEEYLMQGTSFPTVTGLLFRQFCDAHTCTYT